MVDNIYWWLMVMIVGMVGDYCNNMVIGDDDCKWWLVVLMIDYGP